MDTIIAFSSSTFPQKPVLTICLIPWLLYHSGHDRRYPRQENDADTKGHPDRAHEAIRENFLGNRDSAFPRPKEIPVEHFDMMRSVSRAEWDTLLFFYGVILCVGGSMLSIGSAAEWP